MPDVDIFSNAIVCTINVPHPVYPLSGERIHLNNDTWFRFTLPDNSLSEGIHVQLQVGDAGYANISLNTYSWADGDFEYWDGAQWTAWPAEGVSLSYAGNEGRFNIKDKFGFPGFLYWRVRGVKR